VTKKKERRRRKEKKKKERKKKKVPVGPVASVGARGWYFDKLPSPRASQRSWELVRMGH